MSGDLETGSSASPERGQVVSFPAPDRFARIPMRAAGLRIGERGHRVLIAIAGHADRNGVAYPSLATISKLSGIDRRDIPRILRVLERAGLLCREHRRRRGQNVYKIIYGVGSQADSGVGSQADSGVGSQADSGVGSQADSGVGSQADQNRSSNKPVEHRESYRSLGARTRAKTAITPDWQPQNGVDCNIARECGYDTPWIVDQLDRFRDHHIAKGNVFANVEAGWRNWVRRAMELDENPPTPPASTSTSLYAVEPPGRSTPINHALGAPGAWLLENLGKVMFRHWFSDVVVEAVRDDTVHLIAPSPLVRGRLLGEYRDWCIAAWGVHQVLVTVRQP